MARTKTRTRKAPPTNAYINIDVESYETVVREAEPESQYDGDDTDCDNTIRGFRVVAENQSWDFVMPNPVPESYVLVSVIYSTGDSFSHRDGIITHVALLPIEKRAEARLIAAAIGAHRDDKPSYEVVLSDNTTFHVDASPWTGYFESLSDVLVTTVDRLADRMRF